MPRWEEVAVIAETKLGDVDRALAVWRQMAELDPSYQRAREACKRILQKVLGLEEIGAAQGRGGVCVTGFLLGR